MITSIDSNNLPQAVDYLNSRIFKFFQLKRAYKIAIPIWATIYFFFFCIFTYGAVELFIFQGHAKIEFPVLSNIWHWFYDSILPIVDLGIWYFFAVLVIIHVCVLPLIVSLSVKLAVSKTYSPDISELTLDINDKYLPNKLSHNARKFEYAKYVLNTSKLCIPFDIVYVIGIIANYLYMNWNELSIEVSTSISTFITKILLAILILAVAFFAFWGLMALSCLICKAPVSIKTNTNFVVACCDYSLELERLERCRYTSSEFDIAKYRKHMGISPEKRAYPNNPIRNTIPNQTNFNNSSVTTTPYVSIEEKIAAENAYFSGELSAEELNKTISSYWENHTIDEHWPDVGDG